MKLLNRNYTLATCAYCASIFYMSSLPGSDFPPMPFLSADKLLHGFVYAGLTALISIGMRRSNPSAPHTVHLLFPVIFSSLYGLSDEIHQYYVPTRHCEWSDFAADALGALVMQALLMLRLRQKSDPRSTR